MESIRNVDWENVSKNDYLNSGLGNENRIRVHWKPELFGDTKSRKCVIPSTSQWHSISMSDSFVPKYKDGKLPTDPTAKIFTLPDYLQDASTDEKEKGLHLVNDNSSILQVTTAYDTTSNRRLIVDGCKRSLGIMSKISNNQTFPTVTILECYGPLIPQIFFVDFPHVTKK